MSQIKNLSLTLLLVVACLTLSCERQTDSIEEQNEAVSQTDIVVNQKSIAAFDVLIKLVDENTGKQVDPTTLPGYAATNLETGETSYTSRRAVNLFENLPVGTYRFDAYDGYFDGASSTVATVSADQVVTLKYWSE